MKDKTDLIIELEYYKQKIEELDNTLEKIEKEILELKQKLKK